MKRRLKLENGQRVGKFTVLYEVERLSLPCGQKNRAFRCLCDCGNEKIVRLSHLTRGKIQSCGHCNGINGFVGTKIHNVWRGMLNRVKDSYFQSHLYNQKGIIVCPEWKSFKVFKEWAYNNGFNDSLFIDRIDNLKGYYPENCRFTTSQINCSNRDNTFMVNFNNELIPFTILLDKLDKRKHAGAIRGRIKRGWNHQLAVMLPIREGNYYRK